MASSRTPTSARTGSCRTCPPCTCCSPSPPEDSAGGARRGADIRYQAGPEDVIGYLRERQITLTHDPASGTLDAGIAEAAQTITLTAS
jgi:hypothetical protein